VHLLSGLLKCPVCGSPMYTNKHAWTNKDGTYKEIYYYVCSRNRMVRGKHCEYKAMLKKTDIEPMVIEAIREIVRNEEYAQAIKKRIGVQIDTKAVDKELEGYQAKLKEVDLNKTRLEREIDSLPADAKYRERKLHDMTLRLDSLYDVIVELEEKIEDARLRRDAIKQQAITLENIYKIMVNFDCVYNIINDEEKRNVVTALIKEIEIYRNDESEYPLKRIGLNFPVFKDGGEVTELLWDKGNTVDAVNALAEKFKAADGLVLASPVYFASANATLVACLDRLFYSTSFDKTMKVGASVVCGRRGGCSATFDELNKYFTISGMPIASGQYWNSIHGRAAGEAELDEEGRQSMRTLARNMTFLMKSIALGKEKFGLPEKEEPIATNFIR
ncbi:MAG: recombinase zinc beta ribbon domain-containing protein, partial [Oscillospiraceae bacterium]|nr:recombinase zinc beta ribbon domain-containing protein [Oscillospiraceae bacterium]